LLKSLQINSDSCEPKELIQKCKEELQKRLLIDSKMNTFKGIKVLLENCIVLAMLISAVLKMNIQSIIYFFLVVFYMKFKTYGSMRLLMDSTSIMLLARLVIILTNIDKYISRKPYPSELQNLPSDLVFSIPWINRLQAYEQKQYQFAQFSYFLALTMVPSKINSLMVDYVILFLIFIYYKTCQFWCINNDCVVNISVETQSLLNVYMQKIKQTNQSADPNLKLSPGISEGDNGQNKHSVREDGSSSSVGSASGPRSDKKEQVRNKKNEMSNMTHLIKSLQG